MNPQKLWQRATTEQLLGPLVPICEAIIERDGALLPAYAQGKLVGHESCRVLRLERPGFAPEEVFAHWVVGSRKPYLELLSGREEKRIFVLFETDELLIADVWRGFHVQRLRDPALRGFRKCHGNDFWRKVNPYLEHPFVEPRNTRFSGLAFRGLQARDFRNIPLGGAFERALALLLEVLSLDEDETTLHVSCATRETRARAVVRFPSKNAVDQVAWHFASEIATRVVDAFAPFSEAFRSPNPEIGAWASREEASWLGRDLYFHAPNTEISDWASREDASWIGRGVKPAPNTRVRSAIERAELLGRFRRELAAIGIPCDDLFTEISR